MKTTSISRDRWIYMTNMDKQHECTELLTQNIQYHKVKIYYDDCRETWVSNDVYSGIIYRIKSCPFCTQVLETPSIPKPPQDEVIKKLQDRLDNYYLVMKCDKDYLNERLDKIEERLNEDTD